MYYLYQYAAYQGIIHPTKNVESGNSIFTTTQNGRKMDYLGKQLKNKNNRYNFIH